MIRTLLSSIFSALIPAMIFSVGAVAHADATLKVPLFVEKANGDIVPMADFNKVLKAARVPELPVVLEISTKTKAAGDLILTLRDKIEAAASIVSAEWADTMLQTELYPGSANTTTVQTCYTGVAKDVPHVATMMVDGYYSEQMNMFGMRYKKTVEIFNDPADAQELQTYLEENSPAWKNFSGKDETMLIVASVGDGGDDIQESLIPVCK